MAIDIGERSPPPVAGRLPEMLWDSGLTRRHQHLLTKVHGQSRRRGAIYREAVEPAAARLAEQSIGMPKGGTILTFGTSE